MTTWTPVAKPAVTPTTGGSPIGMLLALTYAANVGTTWTPITKASGTIWTKVAKAV